MGALALQCLMARIGSLLRTKSTLLMDDFNEWLPLHNRFVFGR